MKSGTITALLGGAIVAGFILGAFAEVKENPYEVIIARNPFGLRPIPIVEPPKPPEPPPPPPLEIKLTGITTLGGPPRVFLEFKDPQTQKVDRPSPMSEGDPYKDNITIVSIDAENQVVKIKVGETVRALDFDHDGIKAGGVGGAIAGVPVPHPGLQINPAVPPPVTAYPGNTAAAAANGPARGSIVGGAVGGTSAGIPNAPGSFFNPATASTSLGGLPTRPLRTPDSGAAIVGGYGTPTTPTQPVPMQPPAMTREQAEATIELRRRQLEAQNHPAANIMPPTALGNALRSPPTPGGR